MVAMTIYMVGKILAGRIVVLSCTAAQTHLQAVISHWKACQVHCLDYFRALPFNLCSELSVGNTDGVASYGRPSLSKMQCMPRPLLQYRPAVSATQFLHSLSAQRLLIQLQKLHMCICNPVKQSSKENLPLGNIQNWFRWFQFPSASEEVSSTSCFICCCRLWNNLRRICELVSSVRDGQSLSVNETKDKQRLWESRTYQINVHAGYSVAPKALSPYGICRPAMSVLPSVCLICQLPCTPGRSFTALQSRSIMTTNALKEDMLRHSAEALMVSSSPLARKDRSRPEAGLTWLWIHDLSS